MSHTQINVHNVRSAKLTEEKYEGFSTLNIKVVDADGEILTLVLFHYPHELESPLQLVSEAAELVIFPQKELDDGTPA